MQLTIYEAARREERRGADGGEPARDSNNQSIFISFRTRLAAAAQKKPRQLEIIQSHRVRCAPREKETQKARERKGERGGAEVKSDLNLDSFRRQFSLSLCRKATPQQQHEQQNPTTTTTKTSCNLIIYYGQGGVAASLLVAPAPHRLTSTRSMIEWIVQTGLMAAIINQMMFN